MDLFDFFSNDSNSNALQAKREEKLIQRLSDTPERLIREGKEIAAIREIRRETGASLREALHIKKTILKS